MALAEARMSYLWAGLFLVVFAMALSKPVRRQYGHPAPTATSAPTAPPSKRRGAKRAAVPGTEPLGDWSTFEEELFNDEFHD